MTGGVNMAGTPERWEWLKSAWAVFQTMGMDEARLVTPEEIKQLCPIVDVSGIYGGLYDPNEGHLDPYGTTHAYAGAAQEARRRGDPAQPGAGAARRGPTASWDVVTEQGTITRRACGQCRAACGRSRSG